MSQLFVNNSTQTAIELKLPTRDDATEACLLLDFVHQENSRFERHAHKLRRVADLARFQGFMPSSGRVGISHWCVPFREKFNGAGMLTRGKNDRDICGFFIETVPY